VPESPNQTRLRERTASMTSDPTAEFFDNLARRGHEPLLGNASGSARFDLRAGTRTERRLVTIEKGNVTLSRRNAAADCVLRGDRALFDRIATGERNFMAAVLRGEVALGGDPKLLVLLQRLFPRPSSGRSR
jgi:putative sterol carrier protein